MKKLLNFILLSCLLLAGSAWAGIGGLNSPKVLTQTSVAGAGSWDYVAIPAWVNRITVVFSGVSTNGVSPIIVQIGSGAIDATNYAGSVFVAGEGGTGLVSGSYTFTGAVLETVYMGPSQVRYGKLIISRGYLHTWNMEGGFNGISGSPAFYSWARISKTLTGALDRLRLTTVNGTDQFDAGSFNVMYE